MRGTLLVLLAGAAAAATVSDAQRAAARAALEAPAPASGAAEVKAALDGGLADYLAGRYEAAAAGYKYVVTLGAADAAPEAELALMLREQGRPDDAAAHWLKATLLAPGDAFLWSQRGWNYLALGRHREAKDSFRKAVETAQRSDDKGEALLGLGLAESMDGNAKAAAEPLNEAARIAPYARAAANAELARLERAARRPSAAVPYARAALEADPSQPDATRLLARLFEKTGEGLAEWQAWKLHLDMDPGDAEARQRQAKLARFLDRRPEESLPVVRRGRPIFSPERLSDGESAALEQDLGSPPIRVGLFAGPDGRLRHGRRFYVVAASSLTVRDLKIDENVVEVPPFEQLEVSYRADNRVIEIRDARGRIVYVTRQPFRLFPSVALHTVLLKNIELTDIAGMDLSDRELRGSAEVIPTPDGFHLVNELPLQAYLYAVVGRALPKSPSQGRVLPSEAPLEAYKAMAVLARTYVLDQMRSARSNPERTQTCDSEACLVYRGLNAEGERSAESVHATAGITARLPDGHPVEHHASCGWAAVSGVQDRPVPALMFRSPMDLERLLHRVPDEGLYHQASALIPPAWDRWVRVLDADEVRARAERTRDVGPLRRLVVAGRDATGRVRGLRLEGARGELEVSGHEELQRLLSPGSLRSELFAVLPLYDGRRLSRLVLWGAGSGHGRGVCVAGAVGQAALGRRFDQILRHYYPRLALPGFTPPPEPPTPAPPAVKAPKKRPAVPARPPRKRHPPKKG